MKLSKLFAVTAFTVVLSMNNFALAKNDFKVAIVDIPQVVERSPQITALKVDRKNKMDDLGKFVETAKANLEKETNPAKKKSMEEGYNKELNSRKDALDKEYAKKLIDIDKDITKIIKAKAKSLGYDLVLTKSSVLDGGDDITSDVIKDFK